MAKFIQIPRIDKAVHMVDGKREFSYNVLEITPGKVVEVRGNYGGPHRDPSANIGLVLSGNPTISDPHGYIIGLDSGDIMYKHENENGARIIRAGEKSSRIIELGEELTLDLGDKLFMGDRQIPEEIMAGLKAQYEATRKGSPRPGGMHYPNQQYELELTDKIPKFNVMLIHS